jgi:transposase-like protein
MADSADSELKTFRMTCRTCGKGTECVEVTPERIRKQTPKDSAPASRHYRCTECKTGWVVNTGGAFSASSL